MLRIVRASRDIPFYKGLREIMVDIHDGANWTEMDVDNPKPRLDPAAARLGSKGESVDSGELRVLGKAMLCPGALFAVNSKNADAGIRQRLLLSKWRRSDPWSGAWVGTRGVPQDFDGLQRVEGRELVDVERRAVGPLKPPDFSRRSPPSACVLRVPIMPFNRSNIDRTYVNRLRYGV
jgi:hypothetical protein